MYIYKYTLAFPLHMYVCMYIYLYIEKYMTRRYVLPSRHMYLISESVAYAICFLTYASWLGQLVFYMLPYVCYMLPYVCYMLPYVCYMLPYVCNTYAICFLTYASWLGQLVCQSPKTWGRGGKMQKLLFERVAIFFPSQNHSASFFFLKGFDKHLQVACCRPRKYVGADT